jgi:hypothetical protein
MDRSPEWTNVLPSLLRTTAAGLRLRTSPMKWRHKPSSPMVAGGLGSCQLCSRWDKPNGKLALRLGFPIPAWLFASIRMIYAILAAAHQYPLTTVSSGQGRRVRVADLYCVPILESLDKPAIEIKIEGIGDPTTLLARPKNIEFSTPQPRSQTMTPDTFVCSPVRGVLHRWIWCRRS